MLQDEVERSAYVELLQQAARVDRISGEIRDRELVLGLSAVRCQLDAVLTLLADRQSCTRSLTSRLCTSGGFPGISCDY